MTYCHEVQFALPVKKIFLVTDEAIAENIIYKACCFFNVTRSSITGQCRKREIIEARQIAQVLIKQKTRFSLKRIGFIFSRDHTSIIHSIQTVSDLCDTIPIYKARFERFSAMISDAS